MRQDWLGGLRRWVRVAESRIEPFDLSGQLGIAGALQNLQAILCAALGVNDGLGQGIIDRHITVNRVSRVTDSHQDFQTLKDLKTV